jgi:hypothetical protein
VGVADAFGGIRFASKEANKRAEDAYLQNEEYARERLAEEFKQLGIPEAKQNYHDLYELGHGSLAERFDETVREYSSEDTIMLEVRIMYHGIDESGLHSASVSAAVNWESPYHRSSISWMPGFKCEDSKEVEVEFRNLREAKAKLSKAIELVMSKIF